MDNNPSFVNQSDSTPPQQRRGVLVAVILAILALVGIGVLFLLNRDKFDLGSTVDRTSSEEGRSLPPLNVTGAQNPDDPKTAMIQAAKDNPNVFNDITKSMSRDQIEAAVSEKLGLNSFDYDKDGLSNAAEVFIYGTSPKYFDSDMDTNSDGAEVAQNTNPLAADNGWPAEEYKAVQDRIAYWGTDFALSDEQKGQAARDSQRLFSVGSARLLLSFYYNENKKYPVATSWKEAWNQIKEANTNGLFSEELHEDSWLNTAFDPIGTEPYVFGYTASDDGTSYTFSYILETEQTKYQFTDTSGTLGEVQTSPLAQASPVSQFAQVFDALKAAIPIAQAQTDLFGGYNPNYKVTWFRTTDNYRVVVNGVDNFWSSPQSRQLTLQQIKDGFLIAAQHAGGYCGDGICYCNNGMTLEFGENNALCLNVSTPDTVEVGKTFPAAVEVRNTGTTWWYNNVTPHLLGSANPNGNITWGLNNVSLGHTVVPPQQDHVFRFTATAPIVPGSYNFDWQMIEVPFDRIGNICHKVIEVVKGQTPPTNPPTTPPGTSPTPKSSPTTPPGTSPTPTSSVTSTPTNPPTNGGNNSPQAHIQAQGNCLGAAISADGTGSTDSDGTIAQYQWSVTDPQGKAVTVQTSASKISFTGSVQGSYVIRLTVKDDKGAVSTATTSVTTYNNAPVAKIQSEQTVSGNPVTVDGSSSFDPDAQTCNDAVTSYTWKVTDPSGNTVATSTKDEGGKPAGSVITFTPPSSGSYKIQLTVKDKNNATGTQQVTIPIDSPTLDPGDFRES